MRTSDAPAPPAMGTPISRRKVRHFMLISFCLAGLSRRSRHSRRSTTLVLWILQLAVLFAISSAISPSSLIINMLTSATPTLYFIIANATLIGTYGVATYLAEPCL